MYRIFVSLLAIIFFSDLFAQSRLAHHEFEAENISKIHLYGSFCDVEISHDQKIRFLGEIEGYGRNEDFHITSDLTGAGVLEIRVKHHGRKANRLSKARITLQIPQNITLKIENTSGDITGENLINGNYRFKTTSGDVDLSDVIGPLRVETISGDVAIENLRGDGFFSTTSGNKKINNAQGYVSVVGTSGTSYINNVIGDVTISATSGNISLKMIKGSIDVTATSGNIYAHKLLVTGRSKFSLVNGNIKLYFSNPSDDLKFQLVSGSGRLNVNGDTFNSEYHEGDGPIVIEGTTGSGNMDLHF